MEPEMVGVVALASLGAYVLVCIGIALILRYRGRP